MGMERHMNHQSREALATQLDRVIQARAQQAREAEETRIAESVDTLTDAQEPITEEQAPQQQRRVVREQMRLQPYPDTAMVDIPKDYGPLVRAGVALTLGSMVFILLMNAALNRQNSDSPSSEPKPDPTPTFTPGEVRSLRIYNELIQAEKTHPYGYADAFDIIVDGSNIRNRSGVNGNIRGRLDSGTHIVGPNMTILGDNPDTDKIEDEKDKDAETWLAFPCNAVEDKLKFPNQAPSNLPKDKEVCFTHGLNVRQSK